MRRLIAVGVVGLAGCSNAPIAGFLDHVRPSRVGPDAPRDRVRAPDPPRDRLDPLPPPGALSDPVPPSVSPGR